MSKKKKKSQSHLDDPELKKKIARATNKFKSRFMQIPEALGDSLSVGTKLPILEPVSSSTAEDPKCMYLGDRRIQVPDCEKPVVIKLKFQKLVEYLVENRTADTIHLKNIGLSNPSQLIGELCDTYKELQPFIERPGKERKGEGYQTTIIDGRK